MLQTNLNMVYFGTQGLVTPKRKESDVTGIRTHLRFNAYPGYLQSLYSSNQN